MPILTPRFKRRPDTPGSGLPEAWQTLRVLPDSATSLTVYGLDQDTTYEFTVLSRNRRGDGLFSKIVTQRTQGDRQ